MRKALLVSCSLAVIVAASGYYVYQTQYLPAELRTAATRGDLARVQDLIGQGVDVNRPLGTPSNSPLNRAIEGGDVAIVRAVVGAGADVNAIGESGWTPLMVAAFIGTPSVVDLLISAGARIDTVEPRHHNTALLVAVRKGHLETVERLTRARADPNQGSEWGDAPLCRAKAQGRSDIEDVLRKAGGKCGTDVGEHAPR